jgi:hypothetical protein
MSEKWANGVLVFTTDEMIEMSTISDVANGGKVPDCSWIWSNHYKWVDMICLPDCDPMSPRVLA